MDKAQAVEKIEQCFASHDLRYSKSVDPWETFIITTFSAPECPNERLEALVQFHHDKMESHVRYASLSANLRRESERRDELLRLLNFINARVFMVSPDDIFCKPYALHLLFSPRIYMSEEDGFDIVLTAIIPYCFFEVEPVETAEYLTGFGPQLMRDIAIPVFFLLVGEMTAEQAIAYIKRTVLGEA